MHQNIPVQMRSNASFPNRTIPIQVIEHPQHRWRFEPRQLRKCESNRPSAGPRLLPSRGGSIYFCHACDASKKMDFLPTVRFKHNLLNKSHIGSHQSEGRPANTGQVPNHCGDHDL